MIAARRQTRLAFEIETTAARAIANLTYDASQTDISIRQLTTLQRRLLEDELRVRSAPVVPALAEALAGTGRRLDRALLTLSSVATAAELLESRRTARSAQLLTQLGVGVAVPGLVLGFAQTTELLGARPTLSDALILLIASVVSGVIALLVLARAQKSYG
jgi:hypothetical protein